MTVTVNIGSKHSGLDRVHTVPLPGPAMAEPIEWIIFGHQIYKGFLFGMKVQEAAAKDAG